MIDVEGLNNDFHTVVTTLTITYKRSNALPAGTEGADGCNTVAQHLLLDFLADRYQQRDPALCASARSFLSCRLFAEELTGVRSAGSTPSGHQQSQMLQRYHTLAEQLDKGLKCSMDAGHIIQHYMVMIGMLFQRAQRRAQSFQHNAVFERSCTVCTILNACRVGNTSTGKS